jgi:hypothetical protein
MRARPPRNGLREPISSRFWSGLVDDEAGCKLLHEAVQRGLLGVVAFVVERGAVRRPQRLPADGVHARLPRLGPRTVSGRSPRLNRSECRLHAVAHLLVIPFG